MEKTLVTCPVCKTDQHIYAKKICKHISDGGLLCLGSKTPVKEINLADDYILLKKFSLKGKE